MAEPIDPRDRASQAAAISNEMARMHREFYGRGATTVRTIIQRDYVCSVLEDIFTPLERTLIDDGNWRQVKETRLAFQDAMAERFRSSVTQITGQTVRAFLSQVHREPDMAVEFFALDPVTTGARDEAA
jgi:uncharacterized protein YbcI